MPASIILFSEIISNSLKENKSLNLLNNNMNESKGSQSELRIRKICFTCIYVYNQRIIFVTCGKLEEKPTFYCSILEPISDKRYHTKVTF